MNLTMQVVSGFAKGLPLLALWCVVFAVLERIFPSVELKAAKEWRFNLSVSLLYMAVGAIAVVVGDLIREKLRAGLHAGLIDLKIGKTGGIARDIAATLLSLLIFDFSTTGDPLGAYLSRALGYPQAASPGSGNQRVHEFPPSLARGCGTHSSDHDPDGHPV